MHRVRFVSQSMSEELHARFLDPAHSVWFRNLDDNGANVCGGTKAEEEPGQVSGAFGSEAMAHPGLRLGRGWATG